MHGLLMRARRRQLSCRLLPLRGKLPEQPKRGWLRAFREPLGMSLEAFGAQLGVTRQAAHRIEASEANGTITLNRLREAADALGCDVAVVLVPREDLETWVEGRATKAARTKLHPHESALLNDGTPVNPEVLDEAIKREATRMVDAGDSAIWAVGR
ncbi:helix-turn-helix domain-containing protein [bacterium]|nr:MAG: helix-turn-helix domain-containing protein [bacterium]